MENLKKLIEQLKIEKDRQEQIKILQEVGAKLINEYEIKIGNLTIEPLLVEAYYYHIGRFEDTSVHASKNSSAPTYKLARERQKNNFGKLYVHYGTKDGIDIVFSNDESYYLSFLIKNALVDGEWATQSAVSEKICGNCDNRSECKGCECKYYNDIVLGPINSKKWEIVFPPRKGLNNDFANKPLAALPIDKIKEYTFTTNKSNKKTSGKSRTDIIKEYIDSKLSSGIIDEKEERKLKELANGIVAWKNCKED